MFLIVVVVILLLLLRQEWQKRIVFLGEGKPAAIWGEGATVRTTREVHCAEPTAYEFTCKGN